MVTMSGDRRVLSELFDTEWEAMVRLAFLLTGRRSVAEEVVQDAFAALHDRVDDLERPGAYLRRCVVNGAHSHNRRSGMEAARLERIAADPMTSPGALGTGTALPPEIDETRRALEVLDERQRTVVVLRYYADLTVPQIAEAMDAPVGTVKSLLHRALARLSTELSEVTQ